MSDSAGLIFLLGRFVFAFFFFNAGVRHISGGSHMGDFARSVGFPVPALAPWPAGGWLIAASLSIAAGIWPDIGALMLVAFLVPAAVYFHPFWKAPEDQVMMQSQLFWRNVALIGASLALFGVFTGIGGALRYAVTDALIDLS